MMFDIPTPSEVWDIDWDAVKEWLVLIGLTGGVFALWQYVLQTFEPRKRIAGVRERLKKLAERPAPVDEEE